MTGISHFKLLSALSVIAASFLTLTPAAYAHHSFAMYDNSKEVVLDGVVRLFRWTNPHGGIMLTVIERGKSVEYAIELSSPNVMSRQGWNRNSLRTGESVRITIHPLKDGTKGGSFMRAVKANGTVLGPTAPP